MDILDKRDIVDIQDMSTTNFNKPWTDKETQINESEESLKVRQTSLHFQVH